MSAHVIGKSPNSLAFGVPLLACTRRAAAKTDLGELVYFLPTQSPGTPIPRQTCFILYIKHNRHRFCCIMFSCVQTKLPFSEIVRTNIRLYMQCTQI